MTNPQTFLILPAEFVGMANNVDGVINVGGVEIRMRHSSDRGVFVRRFNHDLSVAEILIAEHDGLAQEELDHQNDEAERFPLGPKEYWRGEMVGKYTTGADSHLLTNEEFEADWEDEEDDGIIS